MADLFRLVGCLINTEIDKLINFGDRILFPRATEEEHAYTQKLIKLYKEKEDLTKEGVLQIARKNGLIGNSKIEEVYFLNGTHRVKENPLKGITGYYFHRFDDGTYHLTHAGGMDF